jgi:hypothetical protein
MLRPDTFHGLTLLLVGSIILAPILLPLAEFTLLVIVAYMIACAFLATIHFFYRGIFHGDWA